MTDAFECDRCGELNGGPPALEVATSAMEDTGVAVTLRRRENQLDAAQPAFRPRGIHNHNATYSITGGDLCEGCADAFREFWGGSDE